MQNIERECEVVKVARGGGGSHVLGSNHRKPGGSWRRCHDDVGGGGDDGGSGGGGVGDDEDDDDGRETVVKRKFPSVPNFAYDEARKADKLKNPSAALMKFVTSSRKSTAVVTSELKCLISNGCCGWK